MVLSVSAYSGLGLVGIRLVRSEHVVLILRSPEREVVTQQLHDERAVLVRLFRESVQLGNRFVEGCKNPNKRIDNA